MCPSHLPTIAQLVLGNFRTLFENVAQISIITVAKTPKTSILIKTSIFNCILPRNTYRPVKRLVNVWLKCLPKWCKFKAELSQLFSPGLITCYIFKLIICRLQMLNYINAKACWILNHKMYLPPFFLF